MFMRRINGLCILLLATVAAWGQIDRGTIQGVVSDPSGLPLPETKVDVVGIETNSVLELLTNSEGFYTAPNLPAGNYRLIFQKTGFNALPRKPVEVRPRIPSPVNVAMQIVALRSPLL